MKKVVILGSTGSIGVNALKVVERFPKDFKVEGLSAYNSIDKLIDQVKKYRPKFIAVKGSKKKHFQDLFGTKVKIYDVDHDLEELVAAKNVDTVIIGMRGSAALLPFISAVKAGKIVAPANKEALVIAGDLIMRLAKKHSATIIPVDSEQSAIFQCLAGNDRKALKRILLTASGGALRKIPQNQFERLTVKKILDHPRWKMGPKITVDSATLMNKGFEVLEAIRLFALDINEIDVVIHPEAIIHSMVEYKDGSILAQLGITDMRLPIQFALTYPKRLDSDLPSLDFVKLGQLNFEKPDLKKFPSLALCFHVAREEGTLPSVLNAVDEEVVEAFLLEKIKFTQIFPLVEKVVLKHKKIAQPSLKEILQADQWARHEVQKYLS